MFVWLEMQGSLRGGGARLMEWVMLRARVAEGFWWMGVERFGDLEVWC